MHRYSRPLLIVASGVLVALTVGAILPGEILHVETGNSGALLHTTGAGVLTFLIVLALPRWWLASTGTLLLAFGATELVQPVFGRGAQWSDFWAGGAGMVIGSIAAGVVLAAIRQSRHN